MKKMQPVSCTSEELKYCLNCQEEWQVEPFDDNSISYVCMRCQYIIAFNGAGWIFDPLPLKLDRRAKWFDNLAQLRSYLKLKAFW